MEMKTDCFSQPNPTTPEPEKKTSSIRSTERKKKRNSTNRRRTRKIACKVCNARFAAEANFQVHMKNHFSTFHKMEDLLHRITNRIVDEELTRSCDCIRCSHSTTDCKKQAKITNRFSCFVCGMEFFTGNKLSKHMEPHRVSYKKMKVLQESGSPLFFDSPFLRKSGEV